MRHLPFCPSILEFTQEKAGQVDEKYRQVFPATHCILNWGNHKKPQSFEQSFMVCQCFAKVFS
jgi:hypothetical protein